MLPEAPTRRLRRFSACVTVTAVSAAGLALAGAPQARAAQVALTPVQVDTSATRATGHNDFLADGVRVWTEGSTSTDKAAGYFDVDLPLAAIGEPAMDWANNTPENNYRPGMQLKTDFNGDGDVDGILVGEPIHADGTEFLGDRWWLAGGADRKTDLESPGVTLPADPAEPAYRRNLAPLDEWRTLFPDARVIEAGWSLGSGALGDGVIYSITVGGTDYLFTNAQAETTRVLHPSDVDTSETRATGHNDFRITSGVRVWTEGSTSTDKAAGYFAVGKPFDEVGEPRMQWRANGANTLRPGLQLVVDIDGDTTPDGILVGEPFFADGTPLYKDIAFATNWWLTGSATDAFKEIAPSDDGGNGSPHNGTLAEWRAALPDEATVVSAGWSLGSGVKGDGVIEAITVGTTTYTFTGRNRAPQAPDTTVRTRAGGTVTFTLPGSDPDGDQLAYEADRGTLAGDEVTLEAAPDFVGTVPVHYTVDDGRGGAASGTVTVVVARALSTTTMRVRPAEPTTSRKVRVVVRVTSDGLVDGGRVLVHDDGRVAGTGTLADGRATVTLARKLAKGVHTLRVRFTGTEWAVGSGAVERVRVRR